EGNAGDMQSNEPAKRRQRDDAENKDHLAQETEFRVEENDHEAEDQADNQAKARLCALLVFEMSHPFDAITFRIERHLVGHGSLGIRQKRWQAAAGGIEFHHEIAAIHVTIDRAFALLQFDACDLRERNKRAAARCEQQSPDSFRTAADRLREADSRVVSAL